MSPLVLNEISGRPGFKLPRIGYREGLRDGAAGLAEVCDRRRGGLAATLRPDESG